ncbi:hypothetical protein V8B55DRAFT_1455821 [Mucor lusitanicus]|uniref:sn-1-specific diacylglycerol lipase n=1 Tax=Mucor lusitanicus CBS 277.49 TaxID=747725 RepID=A0A168K402_MUCCL|nr:hypothetical protein MUCCIDRAFT_111320 [Mucor lusitanicus CBS 277.49]
MSTCESDKSTLRTAPVLSRHASFLIKRKPTQLDSWLGEQHSRSLSVPDLHKLSREWESYQQSDVTAENRIIDTKMQIDLLNIRLDSKIKRPQIRLKMGPAQYYSKRSDSSTGDWNEGFVFVVSYHAQLFNTIEFDLYDKPHKHWPTTKHVGKAKLKISTLGGKTDVFVTFLPIYEYRSQRLLPSDVQPTLLETDVIDPTIVSKKTGDLNLIGSVQIRIRYRFQQPITSDERMPNKRVLPGEKEQENGDQQQHNTLYAPEDVFHPLSVTTTNTSATTYLSTHSAARVSSRRTSYGRGDLAQEEGYVDDLFKHRLSNIMTAHIPESSESSLASQSSDSRKSKWTRRFHYTSRNSSVSSSFTPKSSSSSIHRRMHGQHHHRHGNQLQWIKQLITPAKKLPNSSRGRRYGFSQNDSDDNHKFNPDDESTDTSSSVASSAPVTDRLAHGAKKRAQHIIDSVNFGDRDFATQWMQDSFEDVALSHPVVDKLIGLVVSKQTQAMVRAIIKTANSFGQGFRVTGIKLLKAALLIQKFYESLPRPPLQKPVTDSHLIDHACHYFSFALMAYGWRGLCYLGMYGQYVRGARDRRSNRLAIIRYLHLHPEDLLGYEYALRKGASFQPSYYVALDRPRRAIVLSIRGTWSLYDAITDLVCEYMPWKGGLVHSGMLASAQWFYTSIIPQIFRYIHHHGNELDRFIITGHSLGGGTASLLTMMVADHVDELRDLAGNPNFEMHCYNYAPSAVSSPDLCKKYEDYIHSFVCQDDVVGRLSYGTAMKLKELVLDMISAYGTLGGFRRTMTDPKARKVCFDIIAQRRDKLNNVADSMYPSLYIPGRIVQIKRSKETRFASKSEEDSQQQQQQEEEAKERRGSTTTAAVGEVLSRHNIPGTSKTSYSLHYSDHQLSNEMKLTKTCIEDHMIAAYHNAFEALREQHPSPFQDE